MDSAQVWLGSIRNKHTRRTYAAAWEKFLEFAGEKTTPSKDTLRAWKNEMIAQGVNANTIRLRLSAVMSYWRWQGVSIVVPLPRRMAVRSAFWSLDEVQTFFNCVPRSSVDWTILAYTLAGFETGVPTRRITRLAKKYAKRAGLPSSGVGVRMLRLTGRMIGPQIVVILDNLQQMEANGQ